jgi:hypothetical protein
MVGRSRACRARVQPERRSSPMKESAPADPGDPGVSRSSRWSVFGWHAVDVDPRVGRLGSSQGARTRRRARACWSARPPAEIVSARKASTAVAGEARTADRVVRRTGEEEEGSRSHRRSRPGCERTGPSRRSRCLLGGVNFSPISGWRGAQAARRTVGRVAELRIASWTRGVGAQELGVVDGVGPSGATHRHAPPRRPASGA